MSDWRSSARIGLWSYVDLDGLLQDDIPEEIAELRSALECVVPVIPAAEAGASRLTERRRARVQDVAFLEKHVKEVAYVKAMGSVKARYANIREPDRSQHINRLLARAKKTAGGDIALQLLQLRHAAVHLDRLDMLNTEGMRPQHMERPWGAAVEQALRTLVEAGIENVGLRDTLVDIDVGARKVTAAAAVPEDWRCLTTKQLRERLGAKGISRVSLLDLTAKESPVAGSEIWHAASLLSLAKAADWEMSHIAPSPDDQTANPAVDDADTSSDEVDDFSEDAELWSDAEVIAKVQEVAALALEIGRHVHALDAFWLERPAAKQLAAEAARENAAAARRGKMGEQTARVLAAMDEALAGMRVPNVSQAAASVAKKVIGTSAKANRRLYYNYRPRTDRKSESCEKSMTAHNPAGASGCTTIFRSAPCSTSLSTTFA